jgi:uncharacterized surface protein with fasciclin (FAS1) repeats
MKNFCILLFIAFTCSNVLFCQDNEPGFYPPEGSIVSEDGSEVILPSAYLQDMYNETISFYASDVITIDIAGEPFDLPFLSAIITSVNAPPGMDYDCNTEGCVFLPNSTGEVTLYGIPETLGDYNLSLTAQVTINAEPLGLDLDIEFNIPYDGTNILLNLALADDYSPINSFVPEFSLTVNPETNTIIDIVADSDVHTTLETAVIAADLVETLSSDYGPFTLFAPTDSAFSLISPNLLSSLISDPMGSLSYVLSNHIHIGSLLNSELSDGIMVPTLAGTDLLVSITDDEVFLDGAKITIADIQADNGVVHVIDAVMIPSDLGINESPLSTDDLIYSHSVDMLGKRVSYNVTGIIVFDIYTSGKVLKRIRF